MVGGSNKSLGIVDFELVCEYNQLIGNPKPLNFDQPQNPEEIKTYQIEMKNITNKYLNIV